jgi:hypothetical protein
MNYHHHPNLTLKKKQSLHYLKIKIFLQIVSITIYTGLSNVPQCKCNYHDAFCEEY